MIVEPSESQIASRDSASLLLLSALIDLLRHDPSRLECGGGLPPLSACLDHLTSSGLAHAAAILRGPELLSVSGLSPSEGFELVTRQPQRASQLPLGGHSHPAVWQEIDADTTLVVLGATGLDPTLLRGIAGLLQLQLQASQRLLEERQALQEALDQAGCDPLTGLPNRLRALEHLERLLASRSDPLAADQAVDPVVLFIDLDNFKSINDAHGHSVGDHFLITVSKILRQLVHADDLVARLAGDEFIVISQERSHGDASRLADRLIAEISRPMRIGSSLLSHSASIGIARVSPLDRAETVIENADLAMIQAKQLGRGRSSQFDLELRAAARARASTEDALKLAIHNREINCWFQPIVQLPSGQITGFEALARWHDPQRGMISPADFIPVAESSGLIAEIDTLVMRQACTTMAGWRHLAPPGSLHISTNLSARSLNDHRIGERIENALAESGLESNTLYVEITETMLVDNIDSATRTMEKLRRLGVKLAIDDFGTGYSSLRYLKQFPVGFLKIDRSFTEGLGQGGHDDVIVAAVIRMATALGLEVIAEGVEQPEQAELLASLGCHFAQGYLFGRPMDADAATRLLQQQSQQSPGRRRPRRSSPL